MNEPDMMTEVMTLTIPLDHRCFSVADNMLVLCETTDPVDPGDEVTGFNIPVLAIPFRDKNHMREFAQLLISEIDRQKMVN